MVEYKYMLAERNKYKMVIEQWVRHFKEQHKRVPKDSDTTGLAEELKDY
jgi:hypothetical protein